MNFQDLLTKIRQLDENPIAVPTAPADGPESMDELDEVVPTGIGAMAAQAMAKKLKSNPATPASPDNPWNDAEPTKECGDGSTNPTAVVPRDGDDMLTGECGGMMSSPMSAPKQSDSVTMNVSMNGSGAGGIKDLLDIIRNIEKSGGQDSDNVLVGIGAEENFNDATTRPNPQTSDVNAVIQPPSDDIHSKGARGKKSVSISGSNPMEESLVAKLTAKYNQIKGA